MGWENRKNGSYFYTKERIGSRVVSRYIGNSETARLISQFEQMRREEKEIEREIEAAAVAELAAEDDEAERIAELVDLLTKGALIAGGFHQHKGIWRRRRK
jgi:hypothetical protein